MNALTSIPAGVQSNESPLFAAKYSFVAGIGSFAVLFLLCRSKGSNWGIRSAQKAMMALRGVIMLELVCLSILLYFYISIGSPITYHSALMFPNGDDWLYGYARPVGGIFTIGSGMFADMHPVLRIVCFCGSFVQILGDCISCYQIHDYKNQVSRLNAPSNGYTLNDLTVYYWRDLVSIGLCTCIIFLVGYVLVLLGLFLPQLIHPSIISGNFYDRFGILYAGRSKRKFMESADIIFSPPPPLVPRKTLQMKIEEQFRQRSKEGQQNSKAIDSPIEEKDDLQVDSVV